MISANDHYRVFSLNGVVCLHHRAIGQDVYCVERGGEQEPGFEDPSLTAIADPTRPDEDDGIPSVDAENALRDRTSRLVEHRNGWRRGGNEDDTPSPTGREGQQSKSDHIPHAEILRASEAIV